MPALTAARDLELVQLDPRELIVDRNIRSGLGDLSALIESVKQVGVLVPIMVVAEDKGHRVVAGARRTAAAIEAGCLIPAVVRSGIDDAQALLEAQMIENLARENLSAADEARAFEQLSAFGLDEAAMATVTSTPLDRVQRGLAVARSAPALAAIEKHTEVTLEVAAAIAEFEDDKEAVDEIIGIAGDDPSYLPHLLEELRQNRTAKEAELEIRAKLLADGVKVIENAPGWNPDSGPCRLSELANDKGKKLTPAAHKNCPGHVAHVRPGHRFQKPEITYACTNPTANGHKALPGGGRGSGSTKVDTRSDTEREKDADKRRTTIANNKAWRAAEPIRHEFIRSLFARKTAPKGTMRFVVAEILGDPESLRSSSTDADEQRLAEFLGVKVDESADGWTAPMSYGRRVGVREAETVTEAKLPMLLLAQVAVARENTMGVHTWRNNGINAKDHPSAAFRWLVFLSACGYSLSEVERTVR